MLEDYKTKRKNDMKKYKVICSGCHGEGCRGCDGKGFVILIFKNGERIT